MKTLSFWRKSIYSACIFFGTLVVLTIGYTAWNNPFAMNTVGSGSGLTANGWNALVNNLSDHETRVASLETTREKLTAPTKISLPLAVTNPTLTINTWVKAPKSLSLDAGTYLVYGQLDMSTPATDSNQAIGISCSSSGFGGCASIQPELAFSTTVATGTNYPKITSLLTITSPMNIYLWYVSGHVLTLDFSDGQTNAFYAIKLQ